MSSLVKKQSIYDTYFQITQESQATYGPKTILFYQVGAFFEMYGVQDRQTKEIKKSPVEAFTQIAQLNISDKEIDTPEGTVVMAGFRDYSLDKYLKVTTQAGYTAVVYIQNTSNPKAITRELYGVYSPGTYISFETESSQQLSNNTVCIWLSTFTTLQKERRILCGIASAHIFTGESTVFEYQTSFLMNPTTFDELERSICLLNPSEAILLSSLSEKETQQTIQYAGLSQTKIHVFYTETEPNLPRRTLIEKCQKQTYIQHQLNTIFGADAYDVCQEFSAYPTATQALCYLLHFLQERNPDLIKKMTAPRFLNSTHRVRLANHTLQQLNIIDDQSQDGRQSGRLSSVANFVNRCSTPMGRRAFQRQLTNPTSDTEWLNREYQAIESFMTNTPQPTFAELRRELRTVKDLEKILRQTVVQKVYPSTVFHLSESIRTVSKWMGHFETDAYLEKPADTTPFLQFLAETLYLDRCRGVDSLASFQENLFRPGFSENLDRIAKEYLEYQTLFDTIHRTLNQYSNNKGEEHVKIHETEKSGVSLQITKKRAETLRNSLPATIQFGHSLSIQGKDVRFTKASGTTEEIEFPQLTALLRNLQTTKERWTQAISQAFAQFLRTLEQRWYEPLETWIQWTIRLDILQTKAHIALKYNYCRPIISNKEAAAGRSHFNAKGIRHPLIEHIQTNETYVANDLALATPEVDHDGILLFGTNAVGKTSLIRAVGIAILLAQSGCFVPCSTFVYNPYTAIFSRILGNDNLFKGLSTFAVEMSELRVILQSADEKSLVLGDELCSGTEMESALSLFSAGLVELSQKQSTYLFATHFHEITEYDEIRALSRLGLKHMSVRYDPSTQILLYDRLLKEGQGSRMYGLEVCRALYMDSGFLERAYQFRNKYFPEHRGELDNPTTKYNAKKVRGKCEMCHKEISTETHHLSPQRDADERGFIGTIHKNHPGNLAAVCESCHDLIHGENKMFVKKKTTKGYMLQSV
jgi:DNA mismatch repair protein MutS